MVQLSCTLRGLVFHLNKLEFYSPKYTFCNLLTVSGQKDGNIKCL